ncbi:arylsulfatase [Ottowia sp.]|jgi:arylsulfatase|uniref:arylsulfatase n=1 Tax=Ottowia sp. TaxID=1898956 RepID=UPI0025DB4759|nr:arylsulfatase [Ottowia sp.]
MSKTAMPAGEGDPGAGFEGRIGRTLGESLPHWRAPRRPPAGSPNVVVILFDDLGFSDFGCFGGEIHTPNIDRLAAGGLRFTGYTTVPMCTPARAALLTGKNPHSVGCGWLTHNDPGYPGYKGEMSKDAPTMAELLRAQGYATFAAGKWHNTYDANAQPGGDISSWPLQRGFDRFYGFLGAETSYFQPDRMLEGNQPAAADQFPPDYFAPDDYTGRAVSWLAEQQACAPDKPFFLYLAYQTPHTPLQAKPADLARYRGRYQAGWDALRRERFERQRAMGLTEDNAGFSPRNPGVPAWETLGEDQQKLFATHMEVYAALIDNADQNVGRVLDFLRQSGQWDNTLILITSDNGANSVGGPEGVVNLQGRRSGLPEDPAVVAQLLAQGRMGGNDTYAAYPSGWTQVSNTPYRYYKRTPMAGGIRVPLIAHWPQGLADAGALRRQWVHVTDLLPTVLGVTGGAYPDTFRGLRTRALDGRSFAAMFGDAAAPRQRERQYYELQANRGYISGRWKIVSLQAPRQPIQLDNWMLFDLENDPAEIEDLAARHPDTVARLVAEFEEDASANYVYPLDNRDDIRAVTVPPHELAQSGTPRDFAPQVRWVPNTVVSPLIADRAYTLRARFDWQPGDEGVVLAIGDRFCGISLFVERGQLHFVYQWWYSPTELAPIDLQPGAQEFLLDYRALGERRGEADVSLNSRRCHAAVDLSPTMVRVPSGGLTVGLNRREAISPRYAGRGVFRYSGRIEGVRIEPGAQAPHTPMNLDEAAVQAAMRAAAHNA